jgi:hypothetical protein
VLAIAAGVVALGERGRARNEALAADAQRLGASALVQNDFGRALLVARQAVALDDTVQTRGNLVATLLKSPAAIGVLRGTGIERYWSVALSPDGRTLAAGDEFGRLVLFDVRSRKPVASLEPIPDRTIVLDLVYNPDGRYLAFSAGVRDGAFEQVGILDTRTHEVVSWLEDARLRRRVRLIPRARQPASPPGNPRLMPLRRTRDLVDRGSRIRGRSAGAAPVLRRRAHHCSPGQRSRHPVTLTKGRL